ncbi:hypothetical protein K474DRAFT_1714034 [Panus rudis PR-1116 ss-1]|nr:hypothetical protein K474DRAFT_1714034 [Panus rudis PR-1116 ss-1]
MPPREVMASLLDYVDVPPASWRRRRPTAVNSGLAATSRSPSRGLTHRADRNDEPMNRLRLYAASIAPRPLPLFLPGSDTSSPRWPSPEMDSVSSLTLDVLPRSGSPSNPTAPSQGVSPRAASPSIPLAPAQDEATHSPLSTRSSNLYISLPPPDGRPWSPWSGFSDSPSPRPAVQLEQNSSCCPPPSPDNVPMPTFEDSSTLVSIPDLLYPSPSPHYIPSLLYPSPSPPYIPQSRPASPSPSYIPQSLRASPSPPDAQKALLPTGDHARTSLRPQSTSPHPHACASSAPDRSSLSHSDSRS